jgi:hypothetical protein
MAVISIPTSIGGVAIPGGLIAGPLGKLFGKATGSNLLQYPSDLANNPTRAHSVFFIIKEMNPINNKEVATKAVDNVTNTVSQSIQASLKPKTTAITSQIALYMPDTLNMSYSSEYDAFKLTDSLGIGGKIGSTVISAYEDYNKTGSWIQTAKNLGNGAAGAELAGSITNNLPSVKGLNLSTQNGADILLKASGKAINPQMQLLYKGVDLRTFQLDFIFTPKTKDEAKTVKNIIDTFTYYSHPTLGDAAKGSQGQYFIMPAVFEIKFKFTGGDGTFSSIVSSILGSLGSIGSAIAPLLGSKGAENENLYKVGECVLENMSVDYAPNGWSAYADGAPVQTRLTLQFKEMDIVHRGRLTKPGGNKIGEVR